MNPEMPITSISDAKEYFQLKGCQHMHMQRDLPARYEEYRRMGIGKEQETEWAFEAATETIAQLESGGVERDEAWWRHSCVEELIVERRFHDLLGRLLNATAVIQPLLSQRDRLLVAETIVGRVDPKWRRGLIFPSHDSGQREVAREFAQQARNLVTEAFEDPKMEARRTALLEKWREVTMQCGIRNI